MKKKLLAVLMVGVLAASVLTACGGSDEAAKAEPAAEAAEEVKDEDIAEAATEAVQEAVEEQVNAGAEELEVPESTGDMSQIIDSWGVKKMMDAEGNEFTLEEYAEQNGMTADQIQCIYTFNEDGTGAMTLAGIDTQFVWGIDENNQVSIQTANAPISLIYDPEDDLLIIQDANSGITTGFARTSAL